MNNVQMVCTIAQDAKSYEVETEYGKKTLVSFVVSEFGKPGSKGESSYTIEVRFMKDIALTLLPYLVKDKEVALFGNLCCKEYVTKKGDTRFKYYVSADTVLLTGKAEEKKGEAA